MYKVVFYCDMSGIRDKDVSSIDYGNPGIGGTQYLFLLMSTYLAQFNDGNNNEVYLLIRGHFSKYKSTTPLVEVKNLNECFEWCASHHIDALVLREFEILQNISLIRQRKLNIIVWAHNTANFRLEKYIENTEQIQKLVCVSQTQFENMKDSICFRKCVYINNCLPDTFFTENRSTLKEKSVVYIGALVPQKGVHNLLDIWKIVSEKEPDAKLYIIGGGRLRNINSNVGKLNLTDPKYEKKLISRIKKLRKESIEFLGVLSWQEIMKYLANISVGVVNPSKFNRDETFCMTAIEMESLGIPIVSRKRHDGLETTVLNNESGYLGNNDYEIANYIIELLENKNKRYKMGQKSAVHARNFTTNLAVSKWNQLFESISSKESTSKCIIKEKYPFYRYYIPTKDSFLLFKDFIRLIYYKLF